jgi:hypothetical protein
MEMTQHKAIDQNEFFIRFRFESQYCRGGGEKEREKFAEIKRKEY